MLYFPPSLKHVTTLPYEISAADTFCFWQGGDGVHGVRIDGTYWRDVMLNESWR